MSKIENHIARIKMQLRIQAFLKSLIVDLSVVAIALIFINSITFLFILGIVVCAFSGFLFGLFSDYHAQSICILHSRFPSLEFSSELLEKPTKNIAEQLQWERINAQFQGGSIAIWYKNLGSISLVLLVPLLVFWLSTLVQIENKDSISALPKDDFSPVKLVSEKPIQLVSSQVTIIPPSYTNLPKVIQSELEIKAFKGSVIQWTIALSSMENLQLELLNSQGTALIFTPENDKFILNDKVVSSGIYSLEANKDGEVAYQSNFFTLEAMQDAPPVISPQGKELYSYHFAKDPTMKTVSAKVSDDFLISEVFLVATLARGSGENVKFRESRIPVSNQNFKSKDLSVKLDLDKLDFKQGDELYYYWAAMDNKIPDPNFSKSDTYFINYVDSSGMSEAELVGMAIHVMPEFFRSQRQIIIDTEKLLAQKKKIGDATFNKTSNEIGYDQKLLRMRYGQYLGEEEETSAAGGGLDQDSQDMLAGYRHDHDHQDEAGITAAFSKTTEVHSHEEPKTPSTDGGGVGSLLEAYLHNHESDDANTYYEESTRGTLKLALEQMWQSELHLRLYEPEKALPYQEKALEYLKTVQQKSRVYVKRTGFDPPPIKEEEKRLTGDLDKVNKQIELQQRDIANRLAPLAAQALGLLPKISLSTSDQASVQKLGELWTARMNYSGLEDWSVLLLLQEMNAGKLDEDGKQKLYDKLYPLVKQSGELDASFLKQKELEKAFWSKLK
jgi:hypothetical protein